uniref:Uncharacterized protein n=1 Tax=Megaselia scalaris TaxID=36166 RepID=T1GMZ2_MEGSC
MILRHANDIPPGFNGSLLNIIQLTLLTFLMTSKPASSVVDIPIGGLLQLAIYARSHNLSSVANEEIVTQNCMYFVLSIVQLRGGFYTGLRVGA